jgi:hypothetical protein
VTLAVLSAVFVSVTPVGTPTFTVLMMLPVKYAGSIWPIMVYVTVPPAIMLAVVLMLPVPLAVAHDDPTDAAHVHVGDTICAGAASAMVAPVTFDGPWLVTVTV